VVCEECHAVTSSGFHLDAGECILAIEGNMPIHPVYCNILEYQHGQVNYLIPSAK
jgi:hypothetical protein